MDGSDLVFETEAVARRISGDGHTGPVTATTPRPIAENAWSTRVNGAPIAFDYDDVSLVPRVVSTLAHRVDADPDLDLGPVRLALPMIGAPMPDVCGAEMCRALADAGAMGLVHRFQSIAAQVSEVHGASGGQRRTKTSAPLLAQRSGSAGTSGSASLPCTKPGSVCSASTPPTARTSR